METNNTLQKNSDTSGVTGQPVTPPIVTPPIVTPPEAPKAPEVTPPEDHENNESQSLDLQFFIDFFTNMFNDKSFFSAFSKVISTLYQKAKEWLDLMNTENIPPITKLTSILAIVIYLIGLVAFTSVSLFLVFWGIPDAFATSFLENLKKGGSFVDSIFEIVMVIITSIIAAVLTVVNFFVMWAVGLVCLVVAVVLIVIVFSIMLFDTLLQAFLGVVVSKDAVDLLNNSINQILDTLVTPFINILFGIFDQISNTLSSLFSVKS